MVELKIPEEEKEKPKPAIPKPPLPHFAHPYPLQANFTGRVRERRMLTAWLTGGTRPVLALIALGGMGKSALDEAERTLRELGVEKAAWR